MYDYSAGGTKAYQTRLPLATPPPSAGGVQAGPAPGDRPGELAYSSVYDPTTMAMLPGYEQQVEKNGQGYNQFRGEALRRGPGAWALLAKVQQAMEAKAQREKAGKSAASERAGALNDLAMRGGLSSGARERLAETGATNALNMTQGINRQEGLNNLQVGLNDEQQRQAQLAALPGMEAARVTGWENTKAKDLEALMNENKSRNEFNMNKYNAQMSAWAAERQAQATEHSGKK